MEKQQLRDEPIVITIDLTDEFSDIHLQAARLTDIGTKADMRAVAKMKDLKRVSPQIPVEASRNG